MCSRIAIVYNQPTSSRYHSKGEEAAVTGVLEAVEAVSGTLLSLGYDAFRVPLVPPIEQSRAQLSEIDADLFFNLFEGFCGYPETEADVVDIMSSLGIPYTGSPGATIRLALDKVRTKIILKSKGIATPEFQLLDEGTISRFHLSYPCIVKPRGEDASHGLSEKSVVYDFASLKEQTIDIINTYSGQALVEEFIDGLEFNVTVMGNSKCKTLPVSEIVYLLPCGKPKILTFDAKWKSDSLYFKGTRVTCPAEIEAELQEQITGVSLAIFSLLGCHGYARVDLRMDDGGRLYVIEVNPNPDISPGTGAARQAEADGMTYAQFIEKIVQLALEREGDDSKNSSNVKEGQAGLNRNTAQYTRI